MTTVLCGVCETEPKKYKCPTCALPYCSLACFKTHKVTHPEDAVSSTSKPAEPTIPQPPPPAPIPRYLKSRTDFSTLATSPKYQDLLKANPILLSTLQRVYAKTIQPDPEDERRRRMLERNMSRGRGSRGRGRGRGRGGRHWEEREERWTPKKGDKDAMAVLKSIRDGEDNQEEKEAMAQFVELVDELFGKKDKKTGVEG
ncbi:hypothetical protein COCVIDRAFT_91707 [Bipolaris victoriae FI3]|uniref:HIT-type domain-containing protein n=2 Tax=Bipolaris TaxID=33194 RepID=W6YTC9_COCC2|nr:uncharacterized protein COCCADRAFT_35588 [Bipolaris zeicola 26-R-13]XP_014559471.1 hypothetical protein COCVIDRAFT_91707 [Bipolaris victoriae FI3]EUC34766.1 hypothetical protein COCCADRAFT_35588 [Bipolaris zeicola 26-R-13]